MALQKLIETKKRLGIIFTINYTLAPKKGVPREDYLRTAFRHLDVLYINYSKYIKCNSADIYFITCLPDNDDNPKSPNTEVMKLEWCNNDQKYKAGKTINFGAVNLGNKDVYSTILNYIVADANATEYVLFFFNHSSNFGLGRAVANGDPDSRPSSLQLKTMEKSYTISNLTFNNLRLSHVFKSIEFNKIEKVLSTEGEDKSTIETDVIKVEEYTSDYRDDMLTNSELYISLYRAFQLSNTKYIEGKKPIKIIFSAGCFFQNIDTAYALKDLADYLVGAQGSMPPKSFNYPDIINSILTQVNENFNTGTEIDYKAIACETIEKFPEPYLKDRADYLRNWLTYCCISCVDTNYVDELKDHFNKFLEYCIGKSDIIHQIEKIREDNTLIDVSTVVPADKDNPLYIVDFKHFIEQIGILNTDNKDEEVYLNLLHSIDRVIEKPVFTFDETNMKNCNGLSIYFPGSSDIAFETYGFTTFYSPISRTQSYFAKDSYWPDFLLYYYKFLKLNKSK